MRYYELPDCEHIKPVSMLSTATCRPETTLQFSYLQQKHSVPQNSHTHSSLALATASAFSPTLSDPSPTTVLHFTAHSL